MVANNTRKREKRTKLSISSLLQDLREQKQMCQDAEQKLEAYKGSDSCTLFVYDETYVYNNNAFCEVNYETT